MSNAKLFLLSLFFLSLSLHLPLSAPSPSPSPSPNLAPASPASSPAPSPAQSPEDSSSDGEDRAENSWRGGLSRSKKAGIAMGVIVAACVGISAGMVYKKRKQHLRRSRYALGARGEFL
ncbi:cyclin-dependent kinase inhibitor 1C [Cajanus cajan]|uniref:Uncharacterized protein n=1 Tax=Cajanus cajan TaxID=3821 RepID=A0A151RCU5_CAJCA|nr:cyclin-dependent kinase inhibitor 1C [Cajanus cajan]KYP40351.1 hypothetical protein KK1_038312 [Cajanus cajan]